MVSSRYDPSARIKKKKKVTGSANRKLRPVFFMRFTKMEVALNDTFIEEFNVSRLFFDLIRR